MVDNYTDKELMKIHRELDRESFVFLLLLSPLLFGILFVPFLFFWETLTFYWFPLILLYDFVVLILDFFVYKVLNNWYPRPKILSKLLKILKIVVVSWIVFYLFYFWWFLWHLLSLFIPWSDIVSYLVSFSVIVKFSNFILYCLLILFLLAIVILFVIILKLDFWNDEYFDKSCWTRYEIFWRIRKRKRIHLYYAFLTILNIIVIILSFSAAYFEYSNEEFVFKIHEENEDIGKFSIDREKNKIISWWIEDFEDFSEIILNVKNELNN